MLPNDSYQLGKQVAELRSDVRHIQSDVTDIKAEVRATGLFGTLLCLLGRVFKWF